LAAANATGNSMEGVADKYLALGAPDRARLEASYADPNWMPSGLSSALPVAADTSARALSMKYGNPADSPAAQAEMQKYLIGNFILPQTNAERSQFRSGGGLGVNTAGTASIGGAQTTGQGWEALGAGAQTALGGQQDPWAELFKKYGTGSGGGNYGLNIGGLKFS